MPIEITMPALSPTMEEGNLTRWLVKEGDSVCAGDIIAEIETDKATMEVEAVDDGTVAKILIAEGTEGVRVNAVIAILADENEDVADAIATIGMSTASIDTIRQGGEAKGGIMQMHDDTLPVENSSQALAKDGAATRIFITPLARRIAEKNALDITLLKGSGPNGRIVKADVEGVFTSDQRLRVVQQKQFDASSTDMEPAPVGMGDQQVLSFYSEDEYELLPHDTMRRTIASRLVASSLSMPVYYLSMDCELDGMLALRAEINEAAPVDKEGKPAYKISVNDFIIKAMALALRDVPMANVSWTSTARVLHKHSDIGVAVAIPDGLVTPVIRKVEHKSLSQISGTMQVLAKRARDKKLKPEEYQGGSTTISNLGMFGVSGFTSIINPPQASIISVGAGEKRAVIKEGAIAVASVMTVTFAFDHRVIDGALGAQLAGMFKNYMEKPAAMLV